ncbi:atp-dependent RNA helicase rhle [Anaeramoeba ignava]|uniref:Atp-dependent RNA helicase rhle n=1 Tax=Anaeramoeba ignava TaxID=1746090 RepID=A0A9Q0LZY6_ANAIG|nr:atp-dependent RNA helicase rhle [Anaeramoeba ignava]
MDDFIMTIEEDTEVPNLSSDDEENENENEKENEKKNEFEDDITKPIKTKRKKKEKKQGKIIVEDEKNLNEKNSNEKDENEKNSNEKNEKNLNQNSKIQKIAQKSQKLEFFDFNLSRPILKSIKELQYDQPTPIQERVIPFIMEGRDVCGSAITGSGKTASFVIPIIERLLFRQKEISATRVLILSPTRELSAQCFSVIENFTKFTNIRSCLSVGGLSNKIQEAGLRTRPDIIVATPGRMIDHLLNSQSVGLEDIEILVLDEADRLLELGFLESINEIIRQCPKNRQTLMFSATITPNVQKLARQILKKPVYVHVDELFEIPAELTQEFVRVRNSSDSDLYRESLILSLCSREFINRVLIFFPTKREAHRMKIIFTLAGFKAAELHGNLTQEERLESLERFTKHEVDYLVATDVASRGLDIEGIRVVINSSMPKTVTQYVHRIGRTARAGKQGRAITFFGENDRSLLKVIAKNTHQNVKRRIIPNQIIQYWENKIKEFSKDISSILSQEKEEMNLRIAERDFQKAENNLLFEKEILSRPKKVWFESTKQKLVSKSKDLAMYLGQDPQQTNTQDSPSENIDDDNQKSKKPRKNLTRRQRKNQMQNEEEKKLQSFITKSAKRSFKIKKRAKEMNQNNPRTKSPRKSNQSENKKKPNEKSNEIK